MLSNSAQKLNGNLTTLIMRQQMNWLFMVKVFLFYPMLFRPIKFDRSLLRCLNVQEFENNVIPRVHRAKHSTVDNELYSISRFFNAACRPGRWSMDELMDNKLSKYLDFNSLANS